MGNLSVTRDLIGVATGLSVARGDIAGSKCFEGFGEVTTEGDEDNIDVWIADNTQPEPFTAGYQPNLISSSTNDTAAGIGIRTVDVHYLDVLGAEQTERVILNGTTLVNMSSTDVMFINDMHAVSVGSNLVAFGNVDARRTTTVTQRIGLAGNLSLSSMRQVPAGKNLFVSGWHASAVSDGGGKEATMRLRSSSDISGNLFSGVYVFKDTVKAVESATGWLPFPVPIHIPALATIKVSTWTSGAMFVAATWRGWLEDA